MKVLQTLGRHQGNQAGIFQYRRTPNGVNIDARVGQAEKLVDIWITSEEWQAILTALSKAQYETFRLTPSSNSTVTKQPNQSLYDFIRKTLPKPSGGWSWTDSYLSYVCAILEHEGSIDLYHGPLGPEFQAVIALARDF